MMNERVDVFFYGSFMDPGVLAKYGLDPSDLRAASIRDYSIGFTPMATICPCPGAVVWGVVCKLPSSSLEQAYRFPPLADYGYFTQKIKISEMDGTASSAIVYLTNQSAGVKPGRAYLENIIRIGGERKFPKEYLTRLRSFF